jgi:hypothetical protein
MWNPKDSKTSFVCRSSARYLPPRMDIIISHRRKNVDARKKIIMSIPNVWTRMIRRPRGLNSRYCWLTFFILHQKYGICSSSGSCRLSFPMTTSMSVFARIAQRTANAKRKAKIGDKWIIYRVLVALPRLANHQERTTSICLREVLGKFLSSYTRTRTFLAR